MHEQAPSVAEQQASVDAYKASVQDIDSRNEKEMRKQGQPHRAQDFEMTFEKFIVSIYKPAVDLIGARQTIDTLSLLQDKTKGNLTPGEQNMLQNLLYELRMAYLEVTNLITRPPQRAPGADGKIG